MAGVLLKKVALRRKRLGAGQGVRVEGVRCQWEGQGGVGEGGGGVRGGCQAAPTASAGACSATGPVGAIWVRRPDFPNPCHTQGLISGPCGGTGFAGRGLGG